MNSHKVMYKIKSLIYISVGGAGVAMGLNVYNSSEKFYNNVLMPATHLLNEETAHNLAIFINKYRLLPKSSFKDPTILHTKFINFEVSNPVGIAAGFDKNGEIIPALCDFGFGFVEIGSVTPFPQPGNSKPRVFRLPEDLAVINRYGFNSDGHDAVLKRVELFRKNKKLKPIIGVNLGKNKLSNDSVNDYVQGINKFGHVADYLVINISSPNTPGLRSLQKKELLKILLENVISARNSLKSDSKPLILLKLSPDMTIDECKNIAETIKLEKCKIDGLIISNTTTKRTQVLKCKKNQEENGGLSGSPLTDHSTEMIKEMYKLTDGIPIIGVGGIFTGKDAYDKICAGASLIQIYTSFIYYGPPRITRIKRELQEILEVNGYKNVKQAVGTAIK